MQTEGNGVDGGKEKDEVCLKALENMAANRAA